MSHLTPAEHYYQAELNLHHAAAARFGSPEEDSYLRVAAIHASLATVPRSVADAALDTPSAHRDSATDG